MSHGGGAALEGTRLAKTPKIQGKTTTPSATAEDRSVYILRKEDFKVSRFGHNFRLDWPIADAKPIHRLTSGSVMTEGVVVWLLKKGRAMRRGGRYDRRLRVRGLYSCAEERGRVPGNPCCGRKLIDIPISRVLGQEEGRNR